VQNLPFHIGTITGPYHCSFTALARDLTEVINRSIFGVNWYSSFGSGEVQNMPFPIGTITGPYHCSTTALARDILK